MQDGYDRWNALSSAQKLEAAGIEMVEIKQHSSVLHMPTKLLYESILSKNFRYEENRLLEINFQNARCTYDTNENRYVNKKRSNGKVDMVVSLINAIYLLQQEQLSGKDCSIQVIQKGGGETVLWFKKKKKNERALEEDLGALNEFLLKAFIVKDNIDREKALNIPTLYGCVELISNTISTLPIKLYKETDGKVAEIKDDIRLTLLNDDTGDTLDAFQFKKALIIDYLLEGNGYAYINKERGKFKSLHYVEERNVSINKNIDPIFKYYDISVNGEFYKPYEFLKLLKNTKDGSTGEGIIEANNWLLAVSYNSILYENILAKTGGNKKGFIKADKKLGDDEIKVLKEQWNKMYSGNSENCVVLNAGLDFKESASTSTEMQLNENKIANGNEICKIFNVPPSMITGDGKANESDYEKFVKMAILSILKVFVT